MASEPQTPTPSTDEEEEAEGRTRLPRVVVRMSDAMFAAVKAYCEANSLVATQLGRELIATHIGYDLAADPDSPGGTTRQKYADDAQREAGKLRNKTHNGLLRKALHQAHQGQIKKRPLLATAATQVVMELAAGKPTLARLLEMEKALEEAAKAGK